MVNLSPCKKGAPVIASTPHFYMGDEETIGAVEGLSPNKLEHETYVDVEPNTGVTFRAHKRIQISMPLKRYDSIASLAKVQEVILPILWLNESAVVPVVRAEALHTKLTRPGVIVFWASWISLVVGCLMVITGVVCMVRLCSDGPSKPNTHKDVKCQPLKMEDINYEKSEKYGHLYS